MERIQEILTTIDNWLWGNWLLFVLLAVGILYTVISGGVQVRHFKYIIKKTLIHPIRYGDKDTNSEGSVRWKRKYRWRCNCCSGGRTGRDLLDVGRGIRRYGYQIWRDHFRYAVSAEG